MRGPYISFPPASQGGLNGRPVFHEFSGLPDQVVTPLSGKNFFTDPNRGLHLFREGAEAGEPILNDYIQLFHGSFVKGAVVCLVPRKGAECNHTTAGGRECWRYKEYYCRYAV